MSTLASRSSNSPKPVARTLPVTNTRSASAPTLRSPPRPWIAPARPARSSRPVPVSMEPASRLTCAGRFALADSERQAQPHLDQRNAGLAHGDHLQTVAQHTLLGAELLGRAWLGQCGTARHAAPPATSSRTALRSGRSAAAAARTSSSVTAASKDGSSARSSARPKMQLELRELQSAARTASSSRKSTLTNRVRTRWSSPSARPSSRCGRVPRRPLRGSCRANRRRHSAR